MDTEIHCCPIMGPSAQCKIVQLSNNLWEKKKKLDSATYAQLLEITILGSELPRFWKWAQM